VSTIEGVSVVIVAHNTRAYVEQRLEALSATPHELIVVDNASDDGTVELVRARFPTVKLIELAENRGFGAASNEGMRIATGAYFLLLNPDAWPLGDGIERLVDCLPRSERIGAAGPALLDVAGNPQDSAFGFPTRWWTGAPAVTTAGAPPALDRLLGLAASTAARIRGAGERRIFLVGAVLLLRREAIEHVGGFDPDFLMFNEDIDLCWRMWEQGWTVRLCPEARFVHVGGGSTGGDWTRLYREQVRGHLRFLMKHHGSSQADAARRLLARVLRVRAFAASGAGRGAYRQTAAWLSSADAATLLGDEALASSGT
jgi:N-acetylglucosaminyl-diphospho-decaprenol L-rhamnosyltransferase